MTISDNSYVTIQGWMVTKLNLSGTELMLYAIIYGYSQDGESEFFGSQAYMADWCGCTTRSIRTALDNLISKGLIQATKRELGQTVHYRAVTGVGNNFLGGSENISRGVENISYDNITNILDNKTLPKGKDKPSQKSEEPLSDFESKMFSEDIKAKRRREKIEEPKPKKLSLWDKCVQHIEEYTDDEKLREALMQYLKVRLAMRDKPLYAPQFKALLGKLSTLNGSKVNIVLAATQGGWLSFYDEKQNGSYRGAPSSVTFGEHSGMNSNKVSEKEREELLKYGQKF